MKKIQYKNFSLRAHKKNWLLKRPSVCQFELTFGCPLHCRHCYTDCYNRPSYLKKELKTKEVKFILNKVYKAGVLWLCLTGGDPLTRGDFLDIYSYAKEKGFIITVFTSGYSITEEIVKHFKKRPPFVIEMTLNAGTEDRYEKISQVKGSFTRGMKGIELILKEGLPLKIKTQITKDNLNEVPKIKKFIKGLGLKFRPSSDLHARLNGDLRPCNLRISPQQVLSLGGRGRTGCLNEDDGPKEHKGLSEHGRLSEHGGPSERNELSEHDKLNQSNGRLFHCAIGGGDGFHIDPYGNIFPCNLIRKPSFNLLEVDVDEALSKLLSLVRNRKWTTDSNCNGCRLREFCQTCPGRAHVETGDMEMPVEYYCQLARAAEDWRR